MFSHVLDTLKNYFARPKMIPECSSKNSMLQHEVEHAARAGKVHKLTLVLRNDGICYAVVYLKDAPRRPVFLTTRRDRRQPKTYVEQARLLAVLNDNFNDKEGKAVPVNVAFESDLFPPGDTDIIKPSGSLA